MEIQEFLEDLKEAEDASSFSSNLTELLRLVSQMPEGTRLKKMATIATATTTVFSLGRSAYNLWKNFQETEKDYIVSVYETDSLFITVEKWVISQVPENQQNSVILSSKYERDGGVTKVSLRRSMSGYVEVPLTVGNHVVSSSLVLESSGKSDGGSGSAGRVIQINCPSIEAMNAVQDLLASMVSDELSGEPKMYRSRPFGGFYLDRAKINRPIESVILKEGQMDRIVDGIQKFTDNENAYSEVGIPYHTGVLLYGPPGTGKSSSITAIATSMGMDVYYLNLSTLDSDDSLFEAMSEVAPHSMLVIEDIDILSASREREVSDDFDGVTMAGLLNALDGSLSPYGVVTVMTTNRIEDLDPAVIREGRVDIREEMGYIDNYQLRATCNHFLGRIPEGLPVVSVEDEITPAEIVGVMRKYIPTVSEAGDEIVEYIKEKQMG